MKKLALPLFLFIVISISACSSQSGETEKLKVENERLKTELAAKETQKGTENTNPKADTTVTAQNNPPSNVVNNPATVQTSPSITSYESKREEFASIIKQALNAPGLPPMCTDAYFNSKGELIIEVNGEWLVLDKELKKDIVYALTELLRKSKKSLGVEGFGQFFSDAGRPLESFYAN